MEHVIWDERYEWKILKVALMESIIFVGRVCCVVFNGIFLGVLYLYL